MYIGQIGLKKTSHIYPQIIGITLWVFPAAGSITCCSVTGSANGTGYNASFNNPAGVAVDASGNIYVADAGNNLIRKITFSLAPLNYEDGVVTTLAGSGAHGSDNGDSTLASFNNPTGVAVDKAGNVYVADAGNNMIRKIDPSGAVSALAGSGQPGAANGIGALATFNHPTGVAVDASGNVYVADAGNNLIRKITQYFPPAAGFSKLFLRKVEFVLTIYKTLPKTILYEENFSHTFCIFVFILNNKCTVIQKLTDKIANKPIRRLIIRPIRPVIRSKVRTMPPMWIQPRLGPSGHIPIMILCPEIFILFEDNFLDDQDGEFPAHWDIKDRPGRNQ